MSDANDTNGIANKRIRPLFNPLNASCSKLLLFEGFSAILV